MPISSRAAISFSAEATSSACARLSSWHGPAMIEIGRSLPNLTGPAATTGAAEMFAFKGFPYFRRGPCRSTDQDQPRLPPEYQGCIGGYFTDENADGTSNWLTMLSMIWPSSSLLARPAIQSGSD